MRFGYADPPYLNCCAKYGHFHLSPFGCWDDPETHRFLISYLNHHYPDGWVLCLSAPSLRTLLPMTPDDVRVMPWAKSFASFKPGVGLAYTWEPVFIRGGRQITRDEPTVKDHLVEPITLQRGLTGAKPRRFCEWVLAALGYRDGEDELVDLFPGTGGMDVVLRQGRLAV